MFIDPSGTEKTNNVAEVIFKTLVISIEIDTFTDVFESIIQLFNVDFNFNNWFISLPKPNKDIFSEIMLYFTTGFNDFFNNFWDKVSQNTIEFSFQKLIDKPLDIFSELPKLSWDIPAIRFAPAVGSLFAVTSIFEDVSNGRLDTTQGIILGVYNIVNLIIEFIPGVGTILSKFGDIFFKYVNGEYI